MNPAQSLWRFSLDLYGQPGMEAACLDLQERFGADVNLVLYCLWRGRLSGPELVAADTAVRRLRDDITVPLRRMRRALARQGGEAALRESIKQAELEAERLEQALLQDLSPDRGPAGNGAAVAHLRLYAGLLGCPEDAFLDAATPLLAHLETD
ncbi:MAG: TIGR02444 family protein [Alphaproteobacteria bacterium]|nr:TIGR02444 family protein [Alphaproteobacteria bacterium]